MKDANTLKSAALFIGRLTKATLPHIRGARNMSPQAWLGVAGHVIAIAIAITSTVGLYNFGAAFTEDSLGAKFLLLIVALFFGTLFQIVIINGIKMVTRNVSTSRSVAMTGILIVLLMWALTITSSYGSYWNWLSRSDYEDRRTQAGIDLATKPMEDVSIKFSSATASFGQVTKHSEDMMNAELKGESCGYESGVGPGDRWELRKSQKEASALLSSRLNKLNSSLRSSLAGMGVRDNGAIATAYRNARATLLDQAVGDAKNWIAAQENGFSTGFKGAKGTFTCTDAAMMGLMRSAQKSLNELPNIPATPPRLVEISEGQGMLLSFARVFSFSDDPFSQDSDLVPLAIPTLIELVMTILIVLGELGRKPDLEPWDMEAEAFDPRFANLARKFGSDGRAEAVYDFLENHVIELDGAPLSCVVVPCSDEVARSQAKILLLLCSLVARGRHRNSYPLKPHRMRTPFSALPATVLDGWDWISGACDLHLIPTAVVNTVRRRITRQAEAQLFHNYQ